MRMLALVAAGLLAGFPLDALPQPTPYDAAIEALDSYDYPRAIPPLRVAAESGDVRAERLLGFMLLYGDRLYAGVASNRQEALTWLRKAALRGDEAAALVVRRVERQLTPITPP